MEGDPQLFGAMPGHPVSCIVTIDNPIPTFGGRVVICVFMANRRDPMRLSLDHLEADRMASALGQLVPLMQKSQYVNTSQLRRHFWATYRQMGIAGWEATLTGAGKDKS